MTSRADYSNRRQIIVFATPESESGREVRSSVDALSCQLIDRDTDVRFVDISELPDTGGAPSTGLRDNMGMDVELMRLRSDEHPDFELVLIGKDGGVKARTSDPSAMEDFLSLIDAMPMRRAEIRSRNGVREGCVKR